MNSSQEVETQGFYEKIKTNLQAADFMNGTAVTGLLFCVCLSCEEYAHPSPPWRRAIITFIACYSCLSWWMRKEKEEQLAKEAKEKRLADELRQIEERETARQQKWKQDRYCPGPVPDPYFPDEKEFIVQSGDFSGEGLTCRETVKLNNPRFVIGYLEPDGNYKGYPKSDFGVHSGLNPKGRRFVINFIEFRTSHWPEEKDGKEYRQLIPTLLIGNYDQSDKKEVLFMENIVGVYAEDQAFNVIKKWEMKDLKTKVNPKYFYFIRPFTEEDFEEWGLIDQTVPFVEFLLNWRTSKIH